MNECMGMKIQGIKLSGSEDESLINTKISLFQQNNTRLKREGREIVP